MLGKMISKLWCQGEVEYIFWDVKCLGATKSIIKVTLRTESGYRKEPDCPSYQSTFPQTMQILAWRGRHSHLHTPNFNKVSGPPRPSLSLLLGFIAILVAKLPPLIRSLPSTLLSPKLCGHQLNCARIPFTHEWSCLQGLLSASFWVSSPAWLPASRHHCRSVPYT